MSSAPNATLMSEPRTNTQTGWVIVVAMSLRTLAPVTPPIAWSETGIAKVSANQALNPIQKKISQMPWLQAINQPRNGWRARDTKT